MSVGIERLQVYVPQYALRLTELAAARDIPPEKLTAGRGVQEMAVAPPCEDVVTLAATAGARLLRAARVDPEEIGMLLVATETGVDHSKPVSIFVHDLLGIGRRCRVYELKHACYAGTAALMTAADWVRADAGRGRGRHAGRARAAGARPLRAERHLRRQRARLLAPARSPRGDRRRQVLGRVLPRRARGRVHGLPRPRAAAARRRRGAHRPPGTAPLPHALPQDGDEGASSPARDRRTGLRRRGGRGLVPHAGRPRARRRRARRQHLHRLPLPLPRRAARGRGPRARGRAPRALLLRERLLRGVLHRQRAGGRGGGGRRGRRGAARGTHLHRRAGLRAARARWRGGRRAARGLRRRVRLHRRQEPAARVRAPGSAGGVSLGLAAPAPEGVDPARLAAAYAGCARIARGHYENFTIGSWLLPRRLRHDLAAVYAFARGADDLADEGREAVLDRLERLAAWEEQLLACVRDPASADDPIFLALGDTIARHDLPLEPLHDLL